MTTWAKYLIGLALALPMGAYVAASLIASAADDPVNRDPVLIQDAPSRTGQADDGRTPRPTDEPKREPPRVPDDEDDEPADDDVDDNGVRVVTPQPTRLDDGDDDDAGDDRDDGDDDRDESRDDSGDDSGDD